MFHSLRRMVLLALLVTPVSLVSMSDEPAVATPVTPSVICGYYETSSSAYYRHCGKGSVWIHIRYWGDFKTHKKCVTPGEHLLGPSEDVNYARSHGAC